MKESSQNLTKNSSQGLIKYTTNIHPILGFKKFYNYVESSPTNKEESEEEEDSI